MAVNLHFKSVWSRTDPEQLLIVSGSKALEYFQEGRGPNGYLKLELMSDENDVPHYRYYLDGSYHREDGPAVIYWHAGHYLRQEFWLYGLYYAYPEDWFESLRPEQQVKALFNLDEWR